MICGKRPYATRKDADKAKAGLMRRAFNGGRLNAYHCRHCNAFHVGHERTAAGVPIRDHYTNAVPKLIKRYLNAGGEM